MNIKRIIGVFYIFYTVYIMLVVNTTSMTFIDTLPSIVLMWLCYCVFSLGFVKKGGKALVINYTFSPLLARNKSLLYSIAVLSILFSILAARYYTGQTPLSVLEKLMNNTSLYNEYQTFFQDQQRYVFSLSKIPFIFMLFYLKLVLFSSYISLLIVKNETRLFERIYLGIVTLSFVYVGVARGTNFEFFELLILLVYVIFTRRKQKVILPFSALSKMFVLGSIMVFLFYMRIKARGVNFNYYISQDINYDPQGIVPTLSPFLAFVTLIIFGYFGFGFFYMSSYISEVWVSSASNFFAGLLPMGYALNSPVSTSIPDIMRNLIDMGARWHPDAAIMINNYGFLGLLIFCFLMGVFSRFLHQIDDKDSLVYLSSFMVLLQFISLPIGNFVNTSSASLLIVGLISVTWIQRIFLRIKL